MPLPSSCEVQRIPTLPWRNCHPVSLVSLGWCRLSKLPHSNNIYKDMETTKDYSTNDDSSSRCWHNGPLWIYCPQKRIPLTPQIIVHPPVMEINLPRKFAVAFISYCIAESKRPYIKRVQNHAQVDVYVRCWPLKCGGSTYVGHGAI